MRFAERLDQIEERIARACQSSGRRRADVTLVGVSKFHPPEALVEAYESGLRHFGESRLQEGLPKIKAANLPLDVTYHFIGKLQSNKVRAASEVFSVLHTMETESQLRELQKLPKSKLEQIGLFIEVNVEREQQKSGIFEESVEVFHKMLVELPGAKFLGLMTIGPLADDPAASRPTFRRLRELNEKLGGTNLSMGMSDDLEVAIQEGSTHIRVGSALFGRRIGGV